MVLERARLPCGTARVGARVAWIADLHFIDYRESLPQILRLLSSRDQSTKEGLFMHWRRLPLLCSIMLTSVSLLGPNWLIGTEPAIAEDESVSHSTGEIDTSTVSQSIVDRTNEFRKQNSLDGLKINSKLADTAAKFARYMAENEQYGHHADGRTPAERATASGYDYCVVRENIAYLSNTGTVTESSLSEAFAQGWIDSPPHRENMLADFIAETGVAIASIDGVTFYAVQMFGRPQSASIKLSVENDSDALRTLVIEANDSHDEIELPPRTRLTMSRCFPTTLRLAEELPNASQRKITVSKDAELTITSNGLEQK